MFGFSYGEIFLLIGATAALIGKSRVQVLLIVSLVMLVYKLSVLLAVSQTGPKDLPMIARAAGRIAGRAVGYVQMARGQFDNVLQHSQANQVHKELQDAMAQLDAIRYEIRSISLMNPGPMTRKLMDDPESSTSGTEANLNLNEELPARKISKDFMPNETNYASLQSQAVTYARLAESVTMRSPSYGPAKEISEFNNDAGLLNIIPISAESAGMLPKQGGDTKGSDIVLEAILEEEVADKAKHFFAQPENQIPSS